MLELTGELADGWLGTSFIPEHADVLLDPIRRGAERAGRSFDDIEIQVNANLVVSDDVDALIGGAKVGMAFSLGGMGSATTNFYNDAYSRAGFADVADQVRRLWVDGDKAGAIAAVPDEMVLAAYPIGTESMVRDRIRAYQAAGVTTLRLGPHGATAADQIEHLEMAVDLIRSTAEA